MYLHENSTSHATEVFASYREYVALPVLKWPTQNAPKQPNTKMEPRADGAKGFSENGCHLLCQEEGTKEGGHPDDSIG